MSKLDELIAELCPNGVPFKKVKDIYTRIKGTPITARKMKEIACENGEIRIFAGGKTIIDTHEKDIPKANITRVPAVLVQSRGVIDVVYYDKPFTFKNEMWAYTSEDIVSVKFLYYVLKNSIQTFRDAASGMGALPQISLKVTEEFMLPVPPLEVQREIVHILDSFALLTAELTAELTARQKQYSYYRDELLKPQKSIPMVTLKEIATSIYRGAGIKRDQVTENGIPCVRYGEIYTTYNTWFDKCVSYTKEEYVSSPKYFEHGDILFAITGESVEDIAKSIAYIGHDKCLAGGDIVVMKHQQNPRYLAHVLNTTMAREQKGKGKVKNKVVHSNIPSIEQIKIPLPSLEVQERYANILDNFEQICNDLNIGLPAEIEARQKQYEFYRDLLLTFAETNGSLVTDRQTDRQSIIKLLQYVFGYVYLTLDKISENCDRQRKAVTKGKRETGNYPYYGASGIVDYVSDYIFDGDYLLVSEDGANLLARNTPIAFSISGKNWVNNHAHVLKFDTYELRRYVEIYLNSIDLSKYISGGAQPKLNKENLNKINIPIPTDERIKHIVDVLDRFDSLCNDLSIGLPAEIEARQRQYEYYMDRLLYFEEK